MLRALKSVMNATAVTAGCQIYSDVLLGEDVLFGPGSQTMAAMAQESAEESARSHGKRPPFCVEKRAAVCSRKTNISVGFFLPRENIKTMFEHRQAVLSCRMNQVPGQTCSCPKLYTVITCLGLKASETQTKLRS